MAQETTVARNTQNNPRNAMMGGGDFGISPLDASRAMQKGIKNMSSTSTDTSNIYSMTVDRFGYDEIDQLRIRKEADDDGYHFVSLPTMSNEAVIGTTRNLLESFSGTPLNISVEVGSDEEKAAKTYGFTPDKTSERDDYGYYWRTYRKQK